MTTGAGTMDAVNLSTMCGASPPCAGRGPWVDADLENGIFLGNGQNTGNTGNNTPFVTAMLQNNGQSTFALEGGNSVSGGLTTWYDGPLPSGYSPMKQEGAIVLGTGGDNSHSDNRFLVRGRDDGGLPKPGRERRGAGEHRRGGLRRHHSNPGERGARARPGRRWSPTERVLQRVHRGLGQRRTCRRPTCPPSASRGTPRTCRRRPSGTPPVMAGHGAGRAGALRVDQRLHRRRGQRRPAGDVPARPRRRRGTRRTCRRTTARRRRT